MKGHRRSSSTSPPLHGGNGDLGAGRWNPPSLIADLSDANLIALKANAMRRHVLYGEALVNIHTGELITGALTAVC